MFLKQRNFRNRDFKIIRQQSLKIKIAFVHQIDCQKLENEFVQDVDIVRFAVGNLNKHRQISARV